MGIAADFVLIVVAGLIGAAAARLLRLPLLVGYIAAGVAIGPYTAGPSVTQIRDIELLAEIGVALLLFSLGLEISLRDLMLVRRVALFGGTLQIVLTAALGAWAGIALLSMNPAEALWFGSAISLSSTMLVLKTLSSGGVTGTLASRVMIGILVLQDLAVIPLLVILPQSSVWNNALPAVVRSVAIAVAILAATVILGTRLLPPILKWVLRWGSRELFLIAVVAAGMGIGYAMHAAGLSFALGAFVAGIILSESEFSHQALSDVAPLRDIFGLLFFVTVGMLFDPRSVMQHPGTALTAVALIVVGKSAILGSLTRLFGYRHHAPWLVGLHLAQIGEFSFVLMRLGVQTGAVGKPVYDLLLACTVMTMALSPVVSMTAMPLARLFGERRKAAPSMMINPPPHYLENHVIVAGAGRTGSAAARVLARAGVPVLAVEIDHALWTDLKPSGVPAIWGDITRPEILHAAGVEKARVLLVTMPDQIAVRLCVERARHLNPRIAVIARAAREHHVRELHQLGVNAAVQPEFEGGVEMVRQALDRYEVPAEETLRLTAEARQRMTGEPAPPPATNLPPRTSRYF